MNDFDDPFLAKFVQAVNTATIISSLAIELTYV
jgi:hypothetical protein